MKRLSKEKMTPQCSIARGVSRFAHLQVLALLLLLALTSAAQALDGDLNWVKRAGGTGADLGARVAVDAAGNSYVTGSFTGSATFETITLVSAGADDIFITKYNSAGTLQWAKRAGGTNIDQGLAITVDGLGNSYVSGSFVTSATFGAGEGNATTLTAVGVGFNLFVAKYDSSGALVWAKHGGTSGVEGDGIAVDGSGNVFVSGAFGGSTFSIATFGPGTTLATTLTNPSMDLYVAKFNSSGVFQWVRQAGATSPDLSTAGNFTSVGVDGWGNVYVAGDFGTNTPTGSVTLGTEPGSTSTTLNSAGDLDILLAKYDTNGVLQWARRAGGTGRDSARNIAVDAPGNIYLTGGIQGTATFGAFTSTPSPVTTNADLYVAKYDSNGTALWVKRGSGTPSDHGRGIAVDGSGNSYVSGFFQRGTLTFEGGATLTSPPLYDNNIFIAKYDPNGDVQWARRAEVTTAQSVFVNPNTLDAEGFGIGVDSFGNSYVAGSFEGAAMFGPGEANQTSITSVGTHDIFVAKFFGTSPPAFLTTSLVNIVVGSPYTQVLAFSGGTGTLTCLLSGGSAPAGLSVTNDCAIVGTPTTGGSSNFTVTVTDAAGFVDEQNFTIQVSPLSTANVSFSPTTTSPYGSVFGTPGVAMGDFDRDGIQDLAITSYTNNRVYILLGKDNYNLVNFDYDVTPPNFVGPNGPSAIAVGDFNGDGKPDLAITNTFYDLGILIGNGDGTFQAAAHYLAGDQALTLAIGDFNKDGAQDIAVGNIQSSSLSVFIGQKSGNTPTGTFAPAVTYDLSLVGRPSSVTVGDFNRDGHQDLAMTNWGAADNTISIMFGNGSGNFAAPVKFAAGTTPYGLAVGDFNEDGVQDLAVSNYDSADVTILLGNPNGSFQAPIDFPTGTTAIRVVVTDFNGDGHQDLAVANYAFGGFISVLIGNGQGAFAAPLSLVGAFGPQSLAVGDLDRDGRPDLLVGYLDGSVTRHRNTSTFVTSGGFSPPTSFAVANVPTALATADFNRDGILDVAAAHRSINHVSVLLGNSAGGFASPLFFAQGNDPTSLATADFNRDGKPDLVVTNGSLDSVSIRLGNGDGTFGLAINYPVGDVPRFVGVADFNGDGKLDLAVANLASVNFSILLGIGDGTFSPATNYAAGGVTYSLVIGDFNRDGTQDVAVTSAPSNVSIRVGNGDGTFGAGVNYSVGSSPFDIATGDFNGDGKMDLVTTNFNSDNVSILLGNGNGTFAAAQNVFVGSGPFAVSVADINRDGKQDLAVANNNGNTASILFGLGNGTFGPPINHPVGTAGILCVPCGIPPRALILGDINRDGKLDVAVADFFSNNISVLFNVSPPIAPIVPSIITTNIPAATSGFSYNVQLIGDSTVGALTWTVVVGTLPAGMTLSTSGLLSGTPTSAGVTTVTVRATNAAGNYADQVLTFVVEPGAPIQAPAGLVGWWPGDGNASDIVGGNHAALQNGAGFAVGKVAQAFSFDGVDDHLSVPLTASLGMTSAYTFEAWVTFDETTFAAFRPLAVRGATEANDIEIYGQVTTDKICVAHNRGNGGVVSTSCFVPPPRGSLFHLAVTWDGVAMRAYYDGVEQAVAGATAATAPLYTAKPWNFGKVDHASFGGLKYHKGLLDEISLYDRALSQTEIQFIVGFGAGGKTRRPVILTEALPGATTGLGYNEQLLVDSQLNPTWSIVGGALPAGLSLSPSGVISGTPTVAASASFTVRVGDGSGLFAEQTFSIDVLAPPAPLPTFAAASSLAVGNNPRSVAVGDLNRDGKADIAVANRNDNTFSVFLGDGIGGFSQMESSPFSAGGSPLSITIGHLNRDGLPDLVVTNDTSTSVSVFFGQTTGVYGPIQNFPSGATGGNYAAIGDLNRDGRPDIVVAHRTSGTVSVLLQNATGGFDAAAIYTVGLGSRTVMIGDFNRDGKPDLAAVNQDSDTVSILQGNGDGTFVLPAIALAAGEGPFGGALGDFNRDGIVDVAATNRFSHDLSVFLGTGQTPIGNGAFNTENIFQTGANPFYMAAADLNGDGKLDLIAANSGSNDISVLLGQGNGGFTYPLNFPAGSAPGWVATGDFNGDGKPDLAVANSGNGSVSILLNTTSFDPAGGFGVIPVLPVGNNPLSVVSGDFNRDGRLDMAVVNEQSNNISILLQNAAGQFLAAPGSPLDVGFSPRSVAAGDVNRDGISDLAVVNLASSSISVLLGNGDGTFAAATGVAIPTGGGEFVTLADLDLDGKLDLAVVSLRGSSVTGSMSVLENAVLIYRGYGDGTFQAPLTIETGGQSNCCTTMATGDFNRDGKPDLAVSNNLSGDVAVVLQNSSGPFGFGPPTFYPTGFGAAYVDVGDFNVDGKVDLAVASASGANVSILRGIGDGSFQSATGFPTLFATSAVAVGDLNRDGKLDLAAAVYGNHSVGVLYGNGDATFQAPIHIDVGVTGPGSSPWHIVIDDFNRDGKPDIVTANAGSSSVTILLNVNNAPPIANPDFKTVTQNMQLVFNASDLTANDFAGPASESGQTLTVTAITTGEGLGGGTVSLVSGNFATVSYTPPVNFVGVDKLFYTVCDNGVPVACSVGVVNVNVTPADTGGGVNDPPIAVDDHYAAVKNLPLNTVSFGLPGVLANDLDAETPGSLTAELVLGAVGSVTFNPNGSFVYTPVENFTGRDSFNYRVSDGLAFSQVANVFITVAELPPGADPAAIISGDRDGDGVPDSIDNCPLTPNPDQKVTMGGNIGDACNTDVDGDGKADKIAGAIVGNIQLFTPLAAPLGDNCPLFPNPNQEDVDGDNIGDPCDYDADNDGFGDRLKTLEVNKVYDKFTGIELRAYAALQSLAPGEIRGGDCDDLNSAVRPGFQLDCQPALEVVAPVNNNVDPNLADVDNDGLTLAQETALGTNPNNRDSDNDGILDGQDNCPLTPNADQKKTNPNAAKGDACNTDVDGDRYFDKTAGAVVNFVQLFTPITVGGDNCPLVFNPSQANRDNDGLGDDCDPDADGDRFGRIDFIPASQTNPEGCCNDPLKVYSGVTGTFIRTFVPGSVLAQGEIRGGDCADNDSAVRPVGVTEILNNDKDDDCNPATPDRTLKLVFSLVTTIAGENYDNWLPTDGATPTLMAKVVSVNNLGTETEVVPQPTVSFTVAKVTNLPGKYTNDANIANVAADYNCGGVPCAIGGVFPGNVALTSLDYGGSIVFSAQATFNGTLVQGEALVPKDLNGNGIADVWENQPGYGGNLSAAGDGDRSVGNNFVGDGLSNLKEYRGFIWGPKLARVPLCGAVVANPCQGRAETGALYQTPAFVPQGLVKHFRTHPFRKDLFIKYTGYSATLPFALGAAFDNAAIDVWVRDSAVATPGELNLDFVTVKTGTKYGTDDGKINKKGIRNWSWDTKGVTSPVGTATAYGTSTSYQNSANGYFSDKPYKDQLNAGAGQTLKLDALSQSEDVNDNALIETGEDRNVNKLLDGDVYVAGSIVQQLSPFDVDSNGKVELPVANNPVSCTSPNFPAGCIDRNFEYTKAHAEKHTITHEVGHAVGMPAAHDADASCLMFTASNNWSRDHCFGTVAQGQIQIHNQ